MRDVQLPTGATLPPSMGRVLFVIAVIALGLPGCGNDEPSQPPERADRERTPEPLPALHGRIRFRGENGTTGVIHIGTGKVMLDP